MKELYKINVESLTRSDILGEEFYLPYSDDLHHAVLLINRICSTEVIKRKRDLKSEMLAQFKASKSLDDAMTILNDFLPAIK